MHTFVTQAGQEKDSSRLRMEIKAEYMAWIDDRDSSYQRLSADSAKVHVVLYDTSGSTSATILADQVWYYDQQQRIVADGEVIVLSSDGRRLETEWIEWQERDRAIRTDRYVFVTSADETVEGIGLEAAEDLSSYRISRFKAEVAVDS